MKVSRSVLGGALLLLLLGSSTLWAGGYSGCGYRYHGLDVNLYGLCLAHGTGVGHVYGGLVRTKNVLGTMMHSFAAMAIIGVLWVVCGYAMTFGASKGWFGWDWNYFLLQGIDHGEKAYYPITVNGVEMAIPH